MNNTEAEYTTFILVTMGIHMKKDHRHLCLQIYRLVVLGHVLLGVYFAYFVYYVKDNNAARMSDAAGSTPQSLRPATTSRTVTSSPLHVGKDVSSPVVTLFTSFKDTPELHAINTLTVRNWASLIPFVKPVLFAGAVEKGESQLVDMAVAYGWEARLIPKTSQNGLPFVVEMYTEIYRNYESLFYGFVNGGNLFSEDLLFTLRSIWSSSLYPSNLLQGSPFVIGHRRSVILTTLDDISVANIWNPRTVQQIGHRVPADTSCESDYFLTTRFSFTWEKIPNLVTGRRYYDVYLPIMAAYHNQSTLDASATVRSVHLTESTSPPSPDKNLVPDERHNQINIQMYGKIPYYLGCVQMSQYFTMYFNDSVVIKANPSFKIPHPAEILIRDHVNRILRQRAP